jgi:hypothetical protein
VSNDSRAKQQNQDKKPYAFQYFTVFYSTLQHFTGKNKICRMLEIKSMEKGDIHFR